MQLLLPAASAALILAMSAAAAAAAHTPAASSTTATTSTTGTRTPAATPGPTVGGASPSAATLPVGADQSAGDRRIVPRRNFAWPLSPRPVVVHPFEQPGSQWSSGHRGVDLQAAAGQEVLSAGKGVVAFSGVIAGRGVITVRHSGGLRTTYEPVDQRLASATAVGRGTAIGVISPAAGHCAPLTCLHWGAISGQLYRDPLSLLGFGRPILLPLG